MINNIPDKILFYDGDCVFCNASVQFALKHRKKNSIYFSALQSELAKKILGQKGIEIKLDTLYFYKNNKVYSKSSGALQLSKELKFPISIAQFFLLIPPFIRDFLYDKIANNRHQISAQKCLLPTPDEKKLFLD